MTIEQLNIMYDRSRELQVMVRDTDFGLHLKYTRICLRICMAINNKILTELF